MTAFVIINIIPIKQYNPTNDRELNFKAMIPVNLFAVGSERELITNVAANTTYSDDLNANNGIMALFESAGYLIDEIEIESIEGEVDVATTIIGLAIYSDYYKRSFGPSMMFAKDIADNADHIQYIKALAAQATSVADQLEAANPDREARPTAAFDIIKIVNERSNLGFATQVATIQGQRRQFSCAIPLPHIFGFCSNVKKVIYGGKHTVALVRKSNDNDAIWRGTGDAEVMSF